MLQKIKLIIKTNNTIYNMLSWLKTIPKAIYYSSFLLIFRIFPIQNNKIIIVNYYGKGFGDMGKNICEEMNISTQLNKIYWAVKNKYINTIPDYIIPVKYNSILFLYHLATSHIWINNTRFELGTIKRKNQFYIQTWHGGLGLKKIEKEANDLLSTYVVQAKQDSKMIDVMISNCKYRTKQYLNNFWYNGKVLEFGLPRNDIFFKNINLEHVRKKLKINDGDIILLYAPTFRSYNYDYLQIDFERIAKKYKSKYKKNIKILIKLHPNAAEKINVRENEYIINVSYYQDAYELMKISDILISDYSSIFFDFLYTKKPIYLYAPDYEKYIEKRGLNFEYQKLPFSISYSPEKLEEKILNEDYKNYIEKLKEFLKNIKLYDDGKASQRICNLINNVISKGMK